MNNVLPNSEVVVFHNSSHVPFYEEPDLYFKELQIFLSKN
jgi:proline iminopeptidase